MCDITFFQKMIVASYHYGVSYLLLSVVRFFCLPLVFLPPVFAGWLPCVVATFERKSFSNSALNDRLLLFPTLIPLNGQKTCRADLNTFSSCCEKDSAIVFTTASLTSTVLEAGATNDCKCSRDHRLNMPSARRSSR
jgi:hypothetical protein